MYLLLAMVLVAYAVWVSEKPIQAANRYAADQLDALTRDVTVAKRQAQRTRERAEEALERKQAREDNRARQDKRGTPWTDWADEDDGGTNASELDPGAGSLCSLLGD